MRHTPRVLVSGAVTGLLALSLAGAPAQAYTKKEKRAENKQNSSIRKQNSAIKKTSKSVTTLRSSTQKTTDALAKLNATTAADTKKNADTIAAVIPAVTTALTQLRDGLTAAGAGLGQLKTGLEAAGAGLTQLSSLVQSVEYGVARVFVTNGTITTNSTSVSADVPDDGNPNTVNGTVAFLSTAAGATTVDVRAIIRSNEADGAAGAGPVGQIGGSVYVKNLDTGVRSQCTGYPGGFAGTPTGEPIVTPSGPVTTLNLVNIPEGSLRTDTAGPSATSTSMLPGPCGFAATAANQAFEVSYSANFVDVPTSTTPGPRD